MKLHGNLISAFIDDLFGDSKKEYNQYIKFLEIDEEDIKTFAPKAQIDEILDIVKDVDNSIEKICDYPYENFVANLLLKGNFDLYILSGAMGSGKSTLSEYVLDALDNRGSKIFKISYDFNVINFDPENLVNFFKDKLYNQLSRKIFYYLLSQPKVLDEFYELISSDNVYDDLADFFKLFRDIKKSNTWSGFSHKEKVDGILDYIDLKDDKLHYLATFLKYINIISKSTCFIIFIDNIDRLSPSDQRKFLKYILPFAYNTKMKCFVPCRRSTFLRNNEKVFSKYSQIRKSYLHGYLHHTGLEPSSLIIIRLEEFLSDPYRYATYNALPSSDRKIVIDRISEFKDILGQDNKVLSKFINSITGRSVRLALSLVARLFSNNEFLRGSSDRTIDFLIRCFILGESASGVLESSDDDEICNIFTFYGNRGNFSVLPLLILETLRKLSLGHRQVTLQELLSSFDLKGLNISMPEIINCLNYMMVIRRPLVWSSGVNFYPDGAHFDPDHLDDHLQLSEIGIGYMSYLSRFSLQYVQECFCALEWSLQSIKPNLRDKALFNRLKGFRQALEEVFNPNIPSNVGIIFDIFTYVSKSFSNILSSEKGKRHFIDRDRFHLYEEMHYCLQFAEKLRLSKPGSDYSIDDIFQGLLVNFKAV